jgi:hypothetical protein
MKTKQGLLFGIAAMLFAAVCILSGCNDPSKDDSSPTVTVTVTGVTVEEKTRAKTVSKGGTLEFVAKVLGTDDQSVSWEIENKSDCASGTTIDVDGRLVVAANEKTNLMIKIKAYSKVDDSKWGRDAVTVTSNVTGKPIIIPPNIDLYRGEKFQFEADVPGAEDKTVKWSIEGNKSLNTKIDSDTGWLTVARDEIGPITVIAIPNADTVDTDKRGAAEVTVKTDSFPKPDLLPISGGPQGNGFSIAKYEVTQKQYNALMRGDNPSSFIPSSAVSDDYPVDNVSWIDAVKYCIKLSELDENLTPAYNISDTGVTWDASANGYRLPTQAEWEYACRAGSTGDYGIEKTNAGQSGEESNSNYFKRIGWYNESVDENNKRIATIQPVGKMPCDSNGNPTGNGWGLFDMHGNVEEWCWDRSSADISDPYRVVCGGQFNSRIDDIKSNSQTFLQPTGKPGVGFRVVRN